MQEPDYMKEAAVAAPTVLRMKMTKPLQAVRMETAVQAVVNTKAAVEEAARLPLC